jgi:hypothetical protein
MRDGPYFRWRRASEVPGLTPVQKGVLLAITLHSDKNRRCFPKVETLAEYASCSERAARDAVRHLAEAGLIALSRRDGHATTYTILLDSWPQRAVKEGVQPLQGCSDCTPDEIAGVQPLQGRGAAIAGVGVQPLHPTPAAIAPEDAIEETNLKKPIEEAKGESPQVIHGTQATVVLSEPPAEEGPLLELLASSGLTIGQAFTVARKLLEAGIHSPTDEAAAVYDEFSLGNLVGNQHKGKVIPAFRRAGWLPPKERRQATPPPQKAGGLEKAARIWQLADDDNLEESREAR